MQKQEKTIYQLIGIFLFVALIIGITYAYVTASLSGNEEDTSLTITSENGLTLIFTDGSDTLEATGIAPGWSASKTFSVYNPTNLPWAYSIYFNDVNNTFVNTNDLVYTITSTNAGGSKTQTALPTTNTEVISSINIPAGVTQEYTLTVTYLNTASNQIADVGKTFSFEIFLAEQVGDQLKNVILAQNGGKTAIEAKSKPIYGYSELVYDTYSAVIVSSANRAVATAYTFDGTYYQLTNPVINQTYNSSHVSTSNGGTIYYTCGIASSLTNNTGTNCTWLFKINAVDASGNITSSERNTRLIEEIDPAGLYATTDDNGSSYYYYGSVMNNNVIFAGYQWKIIRIDGQGNIRMIYNGVCSAPGCTINTTGTATQLSSTTAFNTIYNDNAYVGYMYGTPGAGAYGATHANTNNSTIKVELDNWYMNNILNQGMTITNKIADVIYCNDRSPSTSPSTMNGLGGAGTTLTYYGSYRRLIAARTPSLSCSQANDQFTVSNAKGNGALTYPVGLITADEADLAGSGEYSQSFNQSFYLYTALPYWTMSPVYFHSNGYADEFCMSRGYSIISSLSGVRPVIALVSSTMISTGDGTSTNPYIIQ